MTVDLQQSELAQRLKQDMEMFGFSFYIKHVISKFLCLVDRSYGFGSQNLSFIF